MTETWKAIDWAPGYEVSDQGRVRSLDRPVPVVANTKDKKCRSAHTKIQKGKILKPGIGRYARVNINGKQCSVHALVAAAFIGPCPEGCVVLHGPGGALDNTLENLSYGTLSQNNGIDRWRDGTIPAGSRHGASKLTEDQVLDIKRRSLNGESRASLAREYNVRPENVSHIVLGRTWGWLEVS